MLSLSSILVSNCIFFWRFDFNLRIIIHCRAIRKENKNWTLPTYLHLCTCKSTYVRVVFKKKQTFTSTLIPTTSIVKTQEKKHKILLNNVAGHKQDVHKAKTKIYKPKRRAEWWTNQGSCNNGNINHIGACILTGTFHGHHSSSILNIFIYRRETLPLQVLSVDIGSTWSPDYK